MTQTNNIRELVEIIEPETARNRGPQPLSPLGRKKGRGGKRLSGHNTKTDLLIKIAVCIYKI